MYCCGSAVDLYIVCIAQMYGKPDCGGKMSSVTIEEQTVASLSNEKQFKIEHIFQAGIYFESTYIYSVIDQHGYCRPVLV